MTDQEPAEVSDTTPLYFPCSACGARIGAKCRSGRHEVKYFHQMRRQEFRTYDFAKARGNASQVAASLEWRARK